MSLGCIEKHRKSTRLLSEQIQCFGGRLHSDGVDVVFENREEKTFLIMREGSTIKAFMVSPVVRGHLLCINLLAGANFD